jgi:hypothetical protein
MAPPHSSDDGRSGDAEPGDDGRPDPGQREPTGEASSDDDPRTSAPDVARHVSPPPPPRRTGVFLDQEDLRVHVGGLLRTILGGHEVDAFGNFTFTHEGARVFVTVTTSPMGPQVGVFSVTNLEVDFTAELGEFLLTTNHTLGFGAFSYDRPNRAVWLRHTLLGTTLDLPELQAAVVAVATTAAAVDERLRDRFGGRTFQDVPGEVQRRMEPPSPDPPGGPPNAGGYL